MSVRLSFGRFLIKLGKFVESLAISFMRSDDLMEFNQSANSTTKALFMFADPDWVNSGLRVEEKELLKQVPVQNGNLLLFGLEGGRKALIFDKAGFKVSGIDSVAKNVELALKNTSDLDVHIRAFVQDLQSFCVSPGSFDLVWLSDIQYSTIPTRKKRIKILKRMSHALKPNGYLICQFLLEPKYHYPKSIMFARKLFAFLTLGNFGLEKGDMVQEKKKFVHIFTKTDELIKEFRSAGFKISFIQTPPTTVFGGLFAKLNSEII